eukprot:SAG31_NODE_31976_length_361_cov_1.297710_1_plen_44_part_01
MHAVPAAQADAAELEDEAQAAATALTKMQNLSVEAAAFNFCAGC